MMFEENENPVRSQSQKTKASKKSRKKEKQRERVAEPVVSDDEEVDGVLWVSREELHPGGTHADLVPDVEEPSLDQEELETVVVPDDDLEPNPEVESSLEILGDQEDGESLDDTVAYEEGEVPGNVADSSDADSSASESPVIRRSCRNRKRAKGLTFNEKGEAVWETV